MFNPKKKTEVFHEAKYKVFLQMGQHQREYRYHQYMKLSREYFDILLITDDRIDLKVVVSFKVVNFRDLMSKI